MDKMFAGDANVSIQTIFNQDISSWNVNNITTYTDFSKNCDLNSAYLPNFP